MVKKNYTNHLNIFQFVLPDGVLVDLCHSKTTYQGLVKQAVTWFYGLNWMEGHQFIFTVWQNIIAEMAILYIKLLLVDILFK